MQQKQFLIAVMVGLIVMMSTQWLTVISSSIEMPSSEDISVKHETDNHDNDDMPLDEILRSEYDEDANGDADVRAQYELDGEDEVNDGDHDWDVLIFTQQWPVTTCYHWREEDTNKSCNLPKRKEFWTIHGIWPTKLGHFGPNFCNKSAEFDVDVLRQIKERLEIFWPDIDEDTKLDWLWKHEWLKHGTCAATLQQLDNELKYFGQGLMWRNSYSISNMLGGAGIHPDSNNTVISLQLALYNALGKNPSIHCLYDHKKDISFLSEIRICFDKQLQLTDCNGVKLGDAVTIDYPGGKVITNCQISKLVHYPSTVPKPQIKSEKKWTFPIVNVYKLLQFIMWFTL